MTLVLESDTPSYTVIWAMRMANYLSIFVIGLLCHVFLFEPAPLNASTFKLGTVSVDGNNRLSDEAIINYARLSPNEILSTEELHTAYTKVLDTVLFQCPFSQ